MIEESMKAPFEECIWVAILLADSLWILSLLLVFSLALSLFRSFHMLTIPLYISVTVSLPDL